MDRSLLLFRSLFLTACGVGGWYVSQASQIQAFQETNPWEGGFAGLAFGLLIILGDRVLQGISLRAFSSATIGLLLGCALATMIKASGLFEYASKDAQWVIHLVIYLVFGYLGTMLALRSNRDEFSLIIPYVRLMRRDPHDQVMLLDTSAIIDGRMGELCESGFLEATLLVPRFVLNEIQNLADSPDSVKRGRGRHGLDLLNELQASEKIEVKIHETTPSDEPVDSLLVGLARVLDARIATTDYNLGRVAELQGVRVLNINLLASALRPSKMSGDRLRLKLTREGKESDQAVGFLPDGTMIVVNHARSLIGKEAEVVISGAIQTSAGRMMFAELPQHSHGLVEDED